MFGWMLAMMGFGGGFKGEISETPCMVSLHANFGCELHHLTLSSGGVLGDTIKNSGGMGSRGIAYTKRLLNDRYDIFKSLSK